MPDHQTAFSLFVCPVHGVLSQREAEDCVVQHHTGDIFGEFPGDDGYREIYYCDLADRSRPCSEPGDGLRFIGHERCGNRLREVELVEREATALTRKQRTDHLPLEERP